MSTRLELLKVYLNDDPDDSFLKYAIAMEYLAVNDHQAALEHLSSLLNDDPDYLAAYYMAGKSAENLNQLPLARNFYEIGISVAHSQKDMHTLSELKSALDQLDA